MTATSWVRHCKDIPSRSPVAARAAQGRPGQGPIGADRLRIPGKRRIISY